jgi:hypothetical protein
MGLALVWSTPTFVAGQSEPRVARTVFVLGKDNGPQVPATGLLVFGEVFCSLTNKLMERPVEFLTVFGAVASLPAGVASHSARLAAHHAQSIERVGHGGERE